MYKKYKKEIEILLEIPITLIGSGIYVTYISGQSGCLNQSSNLTRKSSSSFKSKRQVTVKISAG